MPIPGEQLGIARPTVIAWRQRYTREGLAGLADRPRPGRAQTVRRDRRAEILATTLTPPPQGLGVTHWCSRLLAAGRRLHVICDDYVTHKHQRVQAWLGRHPRVQLRFTPTYASWLNLVEVFFSMVERQALRRGDFASVGPLGLGQLAPLRRALVEFARPLRLPGMA